MNNIYDNNKLSYSPHSLAGDKVQLYLFTFTGTLDKSGNHLTQFTGLLLRPVESLSFESGVTEGGALPEKPRRRVLMSTEPELRKKLSTIK